MSEDIKFWTTFVLALVGALAWIPKIIDLLKKKNINGKIVSRYYNISKTEPGFQTFCLFKLSILVANRSLNLKRIRCEIVDKDGNFYKSTAKNQRAIIFYLENTHKICLINGNEYLNNFSLIQSDVNMSGYLFFTFHENLDRSIESTEFIFESFDGKEISLKFSESDISSEELWYDDNLWTELTQDHIKWLEKIEN